MIAASQRSLVTAFAAGHLPVSNHLVGTTRFSLTGLSGHLVVTTRFFLTGLSGHHPTISGHHFYQHPPQFCGNCRTRRGNRAQRRNPHWMVTTKNSGHHPKTLVVTTKNSGHHQKLVGTTFLWSHTKRNKLQTNKLQTNRLQAIKPTNFKQTYLKQTNFKQT